MFNIKNVGSDHAPVTIKFKTEDHFPSFKELDDMAEMPPVALIPTNVVTFKAVSVNIEYISNLSITQYTFNYTINGEPKSINLSILDEILANNNEIASFLSEGTAKEEKMPKGDVFYQMIYDMLCGVENPAASITLYPQQPTVETLAKHLPGIKTVVKYPCECSAKGIRYKDISGKYSIKYIDTAPLMTVIIHLNDYCAWSREKIADWIDDLHDKEIINVEFDGKIEVPLLNLPVPLEWKETGDNISVGPFSINIEDSMAEDVIGWKISEAAKIKLQELNKGIKYDGTN